MYITKCVNIPAGWSDFMYTYTTYNVSFHLNFELICPVDSYKALKLTKESCIRYRERRVQRTQLIGRCEAAYSYIGTLN